MNDSASTKTRIFTIQFKYSNGGVVHWHVGVALWVPWPQGHFGRVEAYYGQGECDKILGCFSYLPEFFRMNLAGQESLNIRTH